MWLGLPPVLLGSSLLLEATLQPVCEVEEEEGGDTWLQQRFSCCSEGCANRSPNLLVPLCSPKSSFSRFPAFFPSFLFLSRASFPMSLSQFVEFQNLASIRSRCVVFPRFTWGEFLLLPVLNYSASPALATLPAVVKWDVPKHLNLAQGFS